MLCIGKKHKFDMLVENVDRCDLCMRMQARCKVLSEKNGNIDSKVVFIGEAPGRLGADRTQIPFQGDQAGKNFERLLHAAGLSRDETFVTNAVLCNPRNDRGHNAAPTWEEVRNCSLHLSLLLDLIQPELVVSLGQWALNALHAIVPHSIELRHHVRRPIRWTEYVVLPLYHPGSRAIVHRSVSNQIADFYLLGEILGRQRSPLRRVARAQRPLFRTFELSLLQKVVFRIVQQLGTVSKFKLTKLLYLLDWKQVQATGNVLTGSYYIFQKDGPLATGLSPALEDMEGYELSFRLRGGVPTYSIASEIRGDITLSPDVGAKVDLILAEYGALSHAQIKTRAYLTQPIRNILKRQRQGARLLNHPVFDGWIKFED